MCIHVNYNTKYIHMYIKAQYIDLYIKTQTHIAYYDHMLNLSVCTSRYTCVHTYNNTIINLIFINFILYIYILYHKSPSPSGKNVLNPRISLLYPRKRFLTRSITPGVLILEVQKIYFINTFK